MNSKNKFLIVLAAVFAVLIAVLSVLTADHIENYRKAEAEYESYAFGYPDTIKVSLMNGDLYEPECIVLERGDERFARMLYYLDKTFTETADIREYNEKLESLDYSFSYILELFPEKSLSMKIPLYDGELELEAEKALLIFDGKDVGKLIVYTEDKDYIFGKFLETGSDFGMYLYELYCE